MFSIICFCKFYQPYLATMVICVSELPVKEKLARLNDGGPNVPITLLEKPQPSLGIPKKLVFILWSSFSSCRMTTA